jgi:4'-phosphopantetheinyl transferase
MAQRLIAGERARLRLLRQDEAISLWLLDVSLPATDCSFALHVLSAQELARAGRFLRAEDQARFALTRAALRLLLGQETREAPQNLVFAETSRGKPCLADSSAPFFNVSHSGSFALIGLSRLQPVGVDIEWARDGLDLVGLAERFFAPSEYRELAGLDALALRHAFYAIWTGKEAVLKALGDGISEHLQDFAIKITSCGLEIVPENQKFSIRLAGCAVTSVDVPEGYAGAFALA